MYITRFLPQNILEEIHGNNLEIQISKAMAFSSYRVITNSKI